MLKWEEVAQKRSDQNCTLCGRPLMRTEVFTDEKDVGYEGYVCHVDKQVTWIRVG